MVITEKYLAQYSLMAGSLNYYLQIIIISGQFNGIKSGIYWVYILPIQMWIKGGFQD